MKKVFITLVLALVSFTTAFAATNAVKTTYNFRNPCTLYCVQQVGNQCNTGCQITVIGGQVTEVNCFYGQCEPGPPGEDPPDT